MKSSNSGKSVRNLECFLPKTLTHKRGIINNSLSKVDPKYGGKNYCGLNNIDSNGLAQRNVAQVILAQTKLPHNKFFIQKSKLCTIWRYFNGYIIIWTCLKIILNLIHQHSKWFSVFFVLGQYLHSVNTNTSVIIHEAITWTLFCGNVKHVLASTFHYDRKTLKEAYL